MNFIYGTSVYLRSNDMVYFDDMMLQIYKCRLIQTEFSFHGKTFRRRIRVPHALFFKV